jgi:SAM-dependent methyltransferase
MTETETANLAHYIIRGGVEGRERLRILGRVMRPTTLRLFNRLGVREGMRCLDVGCGGGDVTFELARIVGPGGRVVGTDIDATKLEILQREAAAQQLPNIQVRLADAAESDAKAEFDFAYARFLLTHLPDPRTVLRQMYAALRPGGTLAVVDIDFSGYFCYPDSPALHRYVALYTETVNRRGGDANIGPRLPDLLGELQLEDIQVNVVQPAGSTGEVKLISPLTMANIADAVLAEGLASKAEIDATVAELYEFAKSPGTIGCMPRCFEVWGRKPANETRA